MDKVLIQGPLALLEELKELASKMNEEENKDFKTEIDGDIISVYSNYPDFFFAFGLKSHPILKKYFG